MSCEATLRHEVFWWLQGCNLQDQFNLAWQGLTAWCHQLVSSGRYSYFVVRFDGVALSDIMLASYECCWARQSQSSKHFLGRCGGVTHSKTSCVCVTDIMHDWFYNKQENEVDTRGHKHNYNNVPGKRRNISKLFFLRWSQKVSF